ncbi:MAG: hypothetical protein R3279_05910 [Putridiphycobacter sp.]|nr:hypothetical protein [Putridiphycobacter sp.]
MNFKSIKSAMDAEGIPANQKDVKIEMAKGNPVAIIRKKIWFELLTTLLGAILFLMVPFIYDIEKRVGSIYLIFMAITVFMLLGNVIKFSLFLSQTPTNETNTWSTIQAFIYNIKTTLAVYKSYSISSALLVPIPIFALILGHKSSEFYNPDIFLKFLFLDLNLSEILTMLFIYLGIALVFYLLIVLWIRYYYNKHIIQLEDLLVSMQD